MCASAHSDENIVFFYSILQTQSKSILWVRFVFSAVLIFNYSPVWLHIWDIQLFKCLVFRKTFFFFFGKPNVFFFVCVSVWHRQILMNQCHTCLIRLSPRTMQEARFHVFIFCQALSDHDTDIFVTDVHLPDLLLTPFDCSWLYTLGLRRRNHIKSNWAAVFAVFRAHLFYFLLSGRCVCPPMYFLLWVCCVRFLQKPCVCFGQLAR